jgi:hypothetical protein
MEGRWGGGEPRKGKLAEGREGRGRLVFPLAQNFWDPWNGTWTDTSKERRRRGAGTDLSRKNGGCEAGGTGGHKRGGTGFAGQPERQF